MKLNLYSKLNLNELLKRRVFLVDRVSFFFLYIALLPFISILLIAWKDDLLFSSEKISLGYLEDFASLFLLTIGISVVMYCWKKYKLLRVIQHSNYYIFFATAICSWLSFSINNLWVVSQLNNKRINWSTYAGYIDAPFTTSNLEQFNILGIIFYLTCFIYWGLFIRCFWYFVEYFVVSIVEVVKSRSKSIRFTQTQIQVYLDCIRTSLLYCLYSISYYLSLQIHDVVREGIYTFIKRPNRMMLLVLCGFMIVFFTIISRLLKYYLHHDQTKNRDSLKEILIVEIKESIFVLFIPLALLVLYLIALETLLHKSSLQDKVVVGFLLFVSLIFYFLINEGTQKKRSYYLSSLNKEMEQLVQYAHTVNDYYEEIRCYKHDMHNIIQSLRVLVDEERWVELSSYIKEDIYIPWTNSARINDRLMAQLQLISSVPLKGLMLSKFSSQTTQGVFVNIEVINYIKPSRCNEADLCRMMGILIDNAIEAALLSDDKKVGIVFDRDIQNSLVVKVINSFSGVTEVHKLFDMGYSTKGESRGIGLRSIQRMIEKKADIVLNTSIDSQYFIQKIIVS